MDMHGYSLVRTIHMYTHPYRFLAHPGFPVEPVGMCILGMSSRHASRAFWLVALTTFGLGPRSPTTFTMKCLIGMPSDKQTNSQPSHKKRTPINKLTHKYTKQVSQQLISQLINYETQTNKQTIGQTIIQSSKQLTHWRPKTQTNKQTTRASKQTHKKNKQANAQTNRQTNTHKPPRIIPSEIRDPGLC